MSISEGTVGTQLTLWPDGSYQVVGVKACLIKPDRTQPSINEELKSGDIEKNISGGHDAEPKIPEDAESWTSPEVCVGTGRVIRADSDLSDH